MSKPIINENDNKKSVVKWLKSGKFTHKLFARHLPHTAKDISQGRTDGGSVCKELQKLCVWDAEGDDCVRLRHLSLVLADVILPQGSLHHRYNLGDVVSSMLHARWHRPEEVQSVIDTQMSLIEEVKGIRAYFLSDEGTSLMDRCFFPGGTFLRVSPCATLNEAQFTACVHSRLGGMDAKELWRECENVRRTGIVLSRLTEAYHPYLRECWNCKKISDTLLHCGKCESAIYCSRKCQAIAWKGGHKRKCGRLKLLQKWCHEDAKEFERAHLTGVIDGFALSQKADLWALIRCNTNKVRQDVVAPGMEATVTMVKPEGATVTMVKPEGPSMKFFYENLGRVIRGEWWPCDLCTQDGDGEDVEAISPSYLGDVLEFLAFDWLGLAKASDIDDPNDVTSMTDPLFRQECGAPLSAAQLLEAYHSYSYCGCRSPDGKLRVYKFMRDVYDQLLE